MQKCEGKFPDVVFAKVDVDDAEVSVETKRYIYQNLPVQNAGQIGARQTQETKVIGQLHDDVILLQLPESSSLLFSCAN